MIKRNLNNILLMVFFAGTLSAQNSRINIEKSGDKLNCSILYDGEKVFSDVNLGINVDKELLGLGSGSEILSTECAKDFRTYIIGKDKCRNLKIDVKEFDDGVALRYRFASDKPCCIYGEETSLAFPSGTEAWYASGPFQYGWIQSYKHTVTDSITGDLLAPPATFYLPNGIYASITEANLFDYHGAVLYGRGANLVQFGYVENKGHLVSGKITGLPKSDYYHEEVRDYPWIITPVQNEIITPWRVIMLSDNLNGLVNNKIIRSVSRKPDPELFPEGEKTEWIKPGRSVFTWLVEGDKLSVKTLKKYVDGASELGLESVVVDDGWELWEKTENNPKGLTKWDFLKELVDYASLRNVDIWVWRPSSVRYGNNTDIGLLDDTERRNFMRKCSEIGVKGLKIDFFHTENVFTVRFMEKILKDAAKEKLMVVFHGVNKPTGDSYTYPNLLAKEAVRGLECVGGENSWAPGPSWPFHNTVLPFTRWLAGPADYTPLNFRQFCPESITFAHQLATIYMFTSPMLILAADMEDMLSCPARKFIEEVPVVWDETYVLPESKIGKIAAVARRKNDIWYLSILNGDSIYKGNIKLDFLSSGTYKLTMAMDDKNNRKKIVIKERQIKSGKSLPVNLMSGGGCVIKIEHYVK